VATAVAGELLTPDPCRAAGGGLKAFTSALGLGLRLGGA
jgi:hypothetical protein